MPFASIYMLQKALWKAVFFVQIGPVAAFMRIRALNLLKQQGEPTKARQKGVKLTQQMGVWGILDHLEAISIPSISISKGIKN